MAWTGEPGRPVLENVAGQYGQIRTAWTATLTGLAWINWPLTGRPGQTWPGLTSLVLTGNLGWTGNISWPRLATLTDMD